MQIPDKTIFGEGGIFEAWRGLYLQSKEVF